MMNAHSHVTTFSASNQGVTSHSSGAARKPYVIFCVGQDIVRQQQFKSWASALGLPFKTLWGAYNGISEVSFITDATTFDHFIDGHQWVREQESILILDVPDARGRRPAKLQFADCQERDIGLFQSVAKEVALAQSGWTYDPSQDEYFTCLPRNYKSKKYLN